MALTIKIRQLDDGRFKISYCWHWWEPYNREIFDNAEEAAKFISKLMKNTKWS